MLIQEGDFQMKIEYRTPTYWGDLSDWKSASDIGKVGYAGLPDGSTYRLTFSNRGPTEADFDLSIDGTPMGVYRVESSQGPYGVPFVVTRASHMNKDWVFVQEGTSNSREAGGKDGAADNGLIVVKCKPRKETILGGAVARPYYAATKNYLGQRSNPQRSSLDTVLGGAEDNHTYGLEYCVSDLISKEVPTKKSFSTTRSTASSSSAASGNPRSVDHVFENYLATIRDSAPKAEAIGSGYTAFGGRNDQRYQTVDDIPDSDVDTTRMQRLVVRLVATYPEKTKLSAVVKNPFPSNPPRLF